MKYVPKGFTDLDLDTHTIVRTVLSVRSTVRHWSSTGFCRTVLAQYGLQYDIVLAKNLLVLAVIRAALYSSRTTFRFVFYGT